ncbi:DUF4231 domain-containing protein [Sorangium sp. So ce426]|uniref:DUF4231 domain-containing protein n=1 Tax=Sorangium sp. So ce426 TaxID=3133312 RepID=UPI003F5AF14A
MTNTNEQIESLSSQLDQTLVKRIEEQAIWFEQHRHGPRIGFRAVGVLIIFLSASVPVVSTADLGASYKWVIPLLSALVLVATSLQTFFNWHGEWVVYYQTALGLRHVLLRWELTKVTARNQQPDQAARTLIEGASEAAQAFGILMSKEAESFASAVSRSASSLIVRQPEPVQIDVRLEDEHKKIGAAKPEPEKSDK